MRRWIALAGLTICVAPWSAAGPAGAASPLPSTETSGPLGTVEAWLDSDFIVPDAPPGGVLEAGITFWDTAADDLAPVEGVYVHLLPRTGDAAASDAAISADFPGHVVADIRVPEGGPGSIEAGVHTTGGDVPFTFAGTGPPPEAPPILLVSATFHPFVGDFVAGRPYPVAVDAQPRGLWDFGTLGLADGLIAIASRPGQPELATTPLRQSGGPGTPYTGHLTIPDTGDTVLTVAVPGKGGADQVIPGSETSVTVVAGGRPSESPGVGQPPPGSGAPTGDIPVFLWIAGIGALVIIGISLARRLLANL